MNSLICHRIRRLHGVTFTPHELAKWFGLNMSQVHVALQSLKVRGEVKKIREAEKGRYSKVPSLWRVRATK